MNVSQKRGIVIQRSRALLMAQRLAKSIFPVVPASTGYDELKRVVILRCVGTEEIVKPKMEGGLGGLSHVVSTSVDPSAARQAANT